MVFVYSFQALLLLPSQALRASSSCASPLFAAGINALAKTGALLRVVPLPKFASRTQCACKFGRRPQLCLGCFCRRQRLGYAATHSSLFLPLAAVAVRAPAGRAKCTPMDRGKLCSKVNLKSDFSCCMFTVKEVAFRLKPPRGRARRAQGVHLWAAGGIRPKQCGGQPYSRPPQRDPIFRDAKVLLFWCDQQQKE